jgi:hypothetical protein
MASKDPRDVKLAKYEKLLIAAKKAIEEGKQKNNKLTAELKNEKTKASETDTRPDPKKIPRVLTDRGTLWALVEFLDTDVESKWLSFAKQVRVDPC